MKTRSRINNLAAMMGLGVNAWVASSAEITLPVQHRACGIQWNYTWSEPARESLLLVGAVPVAFGVGNGNTSTQLRFDVSPLAGVYSGINSVTVRLIHVAPSTTATSTMEAHQLLPANAAWNSSATFGYLDGTTTPWAGGNSGALVPDVDYDTNLLASVPYACNSPLGTAYDLVISGAPAKALIDQWLGGQNHGLLLLGLVPEGYALDNRIGFYSDGANAPKLIVNYVPVPVPPSITQQPTNTTVLEGGIATFAIAASGAPPVTYQWRRAGTDLSGATNTSYSLASVRTNDNGAQFVCVVTDATTLSQTSQVATLTVTADTVAPTLLGATGLDFTTVQVNFSKPVSAATATNASHYTIGAGIQVLVANQTTPAQVTLTTTPQVVGHTYTLTVSGVRDTSAAGNLIAPGSTANFTTPPSTMILAAQNRAAGVEWGPNYAVPNNEGDLIVGADPKDFPAGNGHTSTQLRFDVTPLLGGYSAIQSVKIRLTQLVQNSRDAGTLEAYRLKPENADWNNNGTWATKDGVNSWFGGANGAMVPDTDYDTNLLASVSYNPANAVGTVYDLEIPGSLASALIAAWSGGGTNEGVVLRGVEPAGYTGDNRVLFYHQGANGPKLIVQFIPQTLAITQQPTNTTGVERGSATFAVAVSGAPPYNYQWRRAGADIPGATNSSYTLSNLRTNDAGAQFSVRVGDASGLHLVSATATLLTVTPDTTPPTLVSAIGLDFMHVQVVFSKPVSLPSAGTAANYAISDGICVGSAELTTDPTTVLLTTCPQTASSTYTLTVSGVRDATAAGNLIAPGSTATFTTPLPIITLPAQHRAAGVQWGLSFSSANSESTLIVGAVPSAFGLGNGNTSTQLRFDVSGLAGKFIAVNSLTIRLTQNLSNSRDPGTLEAYRLLPANANWSNDGTWGTRNGTTAWAGGASGATVAGTDYDTNVLASVVYVPYDPVGTTYDLTLSDPQASALLNAWLSGTNEGLLLKGVVPDGYTGDNRCTFYANGANVPQLIVDYVPALPAPTIRTARTGSQLTLWWEPYIPGYTLESAGRLPAVNWTNVPGVVNNSVTVGATNGTQFFRLKQ
jgi:hypothetical protein